MNLTIGGPRTPMKSHHRWPQDSNENLTFGGPRAPMSTSRSAGPGRLHQVTAKPPFEAIVAEHGATVLRVCRAVLGPADADDAWSETFLAALKAYPRLPPTPTSRPGW